MTPFLGATIIILCSTEQSASPGTNGSSDGSSLQGTV
jgi:hypothetical protein